VLGLGLILAEAIRARGGRAWPLGLLGVALAYGALHVGVLSATISVDRFAIFEGAYLIAATIAIPLLAVVALTGFARRTDELRWPGALGFGVWALSLGFMHLWVVAQLGAGV